jgi:putative transposase
MDWSTRAVLSWRLSNTMDSDFCVQALEEALAKYGKPETFNSDQGSQFTSFAFTNVLQDNGVKISMDGKGRCLDNVFVERLWRSLKYECVYPKEFDTGLVARYEIGKWIRDYNWDRPHSTLPDDKTPMEVYNEKIAA